jgi:hypothetical protein
LVGKAGNKVCLLGHLILASDLLILPNGTIKDVDLGISECDSGNIQQRKVGMRCRGVENEKLIRLRTMGMYVMKAAKTQDEILACIV